MARSTSVSLTRSPLAGTPTKWDSATTCLVVDDAEAVERLHHVVNAGVDRASCGVDDDLGVLGFFVGIGDSRELRDLPASRLCIETLAVTPFTFFKRGGDVHEHERTLLLDHGSHLLAGLVVWRDRTTHGDPAGFGDLAGNKTNPQDIGDSVRPAKSETFRQVVTHDIAVEQCHRTRFAFHQPDREGTGNGRLAGPGQAAQQHRDPGLRTWSVGPF